MHPEHPRYDAIIVGARAAGAATALLLVRHGLRVLVLDRSRNGADTLSTHALMRGGVLQLRRWGLLDRVIDAGTPPIRRTTITYAAERIDVTITPSHGVDALYAPRRTVLDPILANEAEAAGAEIRFGITITNLLYDSRGRVSGVTGHDRDGRPFSALTNLVVGADGARSTVAGLVGARVERAGSGAMAVMYGYWSNLDIDSYEWAFRSGMAAGLIPTNAGQTCVFVAAAPARVRVGRIDSLREILARVAPDFATRVAGGTPPAGVRTFAGRPGFVRRSWGPGWALVGDAGYWKDPITAHGLTGALRDAELLARAVISSDTGEAARTDALADYQSTRDRLSASLFDVTDTVAACRWSDDEIGGLLRQVSAAMVDEVEALAEFDAVAVP